MAIVPSDPYLMHCGWKQKGDWEAVGGHGWNREEHFCGVCEVDFEIPIEHSF